MGMLQAFRAPMFFLIPGPAPNIPEGSGDYPPRVREAAPAALAAPREEKMGWGPGVQKLGSLRRWGFGHPPPAVSWDSGDYGSCSARRGGLRPLERWSISGIVSSCGACPCQASAACWPYFAPSRSKPWVSRPTMETSWEIPEANDLSVFRPSRTPVTWCGHLNRRGC